MCGCGCVHCNVVEFSEALTGTALADLVVSAAALKSAVVHRPIASALSSSISRYEKVTKNWMLISWGQ